MTNFLLALKLGLFAPVVGIALPYLSADAIKPKAIRPGLELGVGLDSTRRDSDVTINGVPHRRLVYMGAGFAGLTWAIMKSASLGTGVKYRFDDSDVGAYVGLAVRFKAVDWGQPHDQPRRSWPQEKE